MALLAEEIVEEWLNRQGYFTIRGIQLGVHEIDLLAIRATEGGLECRHVEVQASVRPVAYISNVPKAVQKQHGRPANSARKRTNTELQTGVREWVAKKFDLPRKALLRSRLVDGPWSRELVVHKVKHSEELEVLRDEGVAVSILTDIIEQLRINEFPITGASGSAFVDLVLLGDALKP